MEKKKYAIGMSGLKKAFKEQRLNGKLIANKQMLIRDEETGELYIIEKKQKDEQQ